MPCLRIFRFIPLFAALSLHAQQFSYPVVLDSVSFSGPGYLSMRYDDGSGILPVNLQWTSSGAASALAYAAGHTMAVSAGFRFLCDNIPGTAWLQAEGPDGIQFPAREAVINTATMPVTLHYPVTEAAAPVAANKIRAYEPFTLHWEISFDDVHWHDAGISENTLYVTLSDPEPENAAGDFLWYETLFQLGCKDADGDSTQVQMIADIWNDFTDRSVLRADGTPLKYYGSTGTLCWGLGDFLASANGACTSWTDFFLALLKVQGFTQSNNQISIYPHATETSCGTIDRFFVKNWHFGSASNACGDMPYTDVYNLYWSTFLYADVTDSAGLPGQSSDNPDAIFAGHVMAYVNGVIYDPSYGVTHADLEEIQNDYIAGYGVSSSATEAELGIDVNGDGDLDTTPAYPVLYISDDPDISWLWSGFWTY